MTLFIRDAVADTPPCWRQPHHPLSVPDVLPSTHDPAVRRQWVWDAQMQRDQTPRLFTLEDRPLIPGPVLFRAHRQTTPADALAWFAEFAAKAPEGHRYVLVDPAAPDRSDDPLDDDEESPK